mgnify:CR=1 FL=1
MLYSREMYNQLKVEAVSGGLTDIQRAANFYARVHQSFAARADSGQSFGLSRKTIRAPRLFNFAQFEQISAKLKRRLSKMAVGKMWPIVTTGGGLFSLPIRLIGKRKAIKVILILSNIKISLNL